MEMEAERISGGKRVGYFFLSLTPMAASLILQVVMVIPFVIIALVKMSLFTQQNPLATQDEALAVYMEAYVNRAAAATLCYHIASLPVFGLWYYFGCKKPKLKQSLKNVSGKAVAIAALGGVVMCLLSEGMVGVEQFIVPNLVEKYMELMEAAGIGVDVLTIIAAVILAPIGEEIVCRGITLYYAKKAFPRFWMANILQAVMFGIMHANWIQGLYAFAIGLMLGYLTERYHSLIPAMILHFVVNFSSTVWVEKVFGGWFPDELYAYLILFFLMLAAAIGLVLWGGPVKSREKADNKAMES